VLADAVVSFPGTARKSFRATGKGFNICMRKTQERPAPNDSRFATPIAVFNCGTPWRCSLVRPITLSGEALTSMDHYAEGLGIYVVDGLADVGENGSQPNN
jgi:hypothetical protein